ncbi:hypothetical protein, partial [Legionella spiritensis]
MKLKKLDLAACFQEYLNLYNQFYEIKKSFAQHENGQNSLSASQLDENITELGSIRDELRIIKFNVDHRGFFKTDKAAKKLDDIVTVVEINQLEKQMKSCSKNLRENEQDS